MLSQNHYSVTDAARILGIDKNQFDYHVHDGNIPTFKHVKENRVRRIVILNIGYFGLTNFLKRTIGNWRK